MVYCRNCGHELNKGIKYCQNCGASQQLRFYSPITSLTTPSWKPISAGTLLFGAGILFFITGLAIFDIFWEYRNDSYYSPFLVFSLIYLLGFYLCFKGAILTFQRKNYKSARNAIIFALICSLGTYIWMGRHFMIRSLIIIILTVLGLIFTFLSKYEFILSIDTSLKPEIYIPKQPTQPSYGATIKGRERIIPAQESIPEFKPIFHSI